MCGIAGIIGHSEPAAIADMVSAISHRGPDDKGIFRENAFALGMTRLAILDTTTAGHQPMQSQDGLIIIIYNGEIYNFQAERKKLQEKGYSFTSYSDTEVVLHMYQEYGDDFLRRLRGMFALAILDKRKGSGRERLILARDHLGIKPLLYCQTDKNFIFASEIKSLLASGLVERNIEPEAVRLLLTFGSVTQPYSMIRGVKMLLPGHYLVFENGTERTIRYWKLNEKRQSSNIAQCSYSELVSLVREKIEESVRLQMVSDVPLGAFLSGGVDSSLLVALMARNSCQPIKTFSVGFEAEGASIDESLDAQKTAAFIGTDHHRVVIKEQDVFNHINHIAAALDQPSVDGVNSYFVSLAARQSVSVAISGTGGDELFAGYPWFITMVNWANQRDRHRFGLKLQSLFAKMARWKIMDPFSCGNNRYAHLLRTLRSSHGFVSQFARIFQIFGECGAASFLSAEMRSQTMIGHEPSLDIMHADELSNALPLERVSALCLRGYTQNQLLRDIDAVSMGHSLEVRVPFLDPVLTDLALSLPREAKLGNLEGIENPETASYRATGTKKILVDVAMDLLPPGMDKQPKRGFAMPFTPWLKGSLRDVLEDTLSSSAVVNRGLFDKTAVNSLKDNFYADKGGWPQSWLLMMTELWCREVLDA